MPSPLLRPLTPATEAYQQEQQAMAPVNQQAAEMDTIAQAQASEQAFAKQVQGQAAEAERVQRKQIAEQKAQESRQKEMLANAKRAGVKTTFDGGGQEQPVLHPDGQPVFEHGFQGDVQPGDNGHTVDYRDPRGRVYKVPTKAIRSSQDPAGNPLYEFDIKKEDGATDTIRQPVGSKPLWNTDPKTGKMYTGAADPETGSYGQTEIGVDTTVAGKAAIARQKELFDQQQAERKFQSESLMLDQNVRETNLAPVKKQLSEAQAAAKKLEKSKLKYRDDPEKGLMAVQDWGNGQVGETKIDPATNPDDIIKAKAWIEQKTATDKALADAKAAHDPLAAEVQTMQQKRDQLAIDALNHSRSAQVQMMQMEKAQKAGLPVHEPDWQKRIAAARTDPRITSIFSQAELDQMGGPLAEDAKRVSLPETTKLMQRAFTPDFNLDGTLTEDPTAAPAVPMQRPEASLANHISDRLAVGNVAQKSAYGYPIKSAKELGLDDYFKKHPEVAGMAWGGGENDSGKDEPRVIVPNEYNKYMSDPVKREGLAKIEAARHKMTEVGYNPSFAITPEQQQWRKGLGAYAQNDKAFKQSIVSRLLAHDDVPGVTAQQQSDAQEFERKYLPSTSATDVKSLTTRALGITNPEQWQVSPSQGISGELGYHTLTHNGEDIGEFSTRENRFVLNPPSSSDMDRQQQRLINTSSDGLPVYFASDTPPLPKAAVSDMIRQGVDISRSSTDRAAVESKLAEAKLSPADLRQKVMNGELSVQDGRLLNETFHGIKDVDASKPAIEAAFGQHLASPVLGPLFKKGDLTTRQGIVNQFMDAYAERAGSNIIAPNRSELAKLRSELLAKADPRGTTGKGVDFALDLPKNIIAPLAGMIVEAVSVPLWYGPRKLLGYKDEAADIIYNGSRDLAQRQLNTANFAHRLFGQGEMKDILGELKTSSDKIQSVDELPDEVAHKLRDAAYDGYHRFTDENAKDVNTTRDNYDIKKDPTLRAMFDRYLKTADGGTFDSMLQMLSMTANDRATQKQTMQYLERPQTATTDNVIERAKLLDMPLDGGKAAQVLTIGKQLDSIKDEKQYKNLITQAGKVLGLEKPADVQMALSHLTREETDAPDSWRSLFRAGTVADVGEFATEVGSDILTGALTASIMGAPEAGMIKAAQVGARQGLKRAFMAPVTALRDGFSKVVGGGLDSLAEKSARFGSGRAMLAKTGGELADKYRKIGITTPKFGQPLTAIQKGRNVAVGLAKSAAAAAPIEATEEGVSALLQANPNKEDLVNSMVMGALGGTVLVPMFAGAQSLNRAWQSGKRNQSITDYKTGLVDKFNQRMAGQAGFTPLTVADFDIMQGIQDNPAHQSALQDHAAALEELGAATQEHTQNVISSPDTRRQQIQARLSELEDQHGPRSEVTMGKDGLPTNRKDSRINTTEEGLLLKELESIDAEHPSSGPLPPSPRLLAAQANAQRTAANVEGLSSMAFSATDELRALPDDQRPLYTGIAKAVSGATDYTEAEGKALIGLGGQFAIAFQQAQSLPADVAGPANVTQLPGAPTVTPTGIGSYRLPAGVRIQVPPQAIAALQERAPSLTGLIGGTQQNAAPVQNGEKAVNTPQNTGSNVPQQNGAEQASAQNGPETAPTPAPNRLTPALETRLKQHGLTVSYTPEEQAEVNQKWGPQSPFNIPPAFVQGGKGTAVAMPKDAAMDDTPISENEVLSAVQNVVEKELRKRNTIAGRPLIVTSHYQAHDGGADYNYSNDTVRVNPLRLAISIWADRSTKPTRAEVARAAELVIDHEVVHAAQMQAARDTFSKLPADQQSQGFMPWVSEHYGAMWRDDLKDVHDATMKIYGSVLEGRPDWHKAFEALRMIVQERTAGSTSEAATFLTDRLREHLKAALAVLKRWYADVMAGVADKPAIKAEIEAIEALLANNSQAVTHAINNTTNTNENQTGNEKGNGQGRQGQEVLLTGSAASPPNTGGEVASLNFNVPLTKRGQVRQSVFPDAESLAAFQFKLDLDTAASAKSTPEESAAAKQRGIALLAKMMEDSPLTRPELEKKLLEYHADVVTQAEGTSALDTFTPPAFHTYAKTDELASKSLPPPAGGDIISGMQAQGIRRIGPPVDSADWSWYRELEADAEGSKMKPGEAQRLARAGDVTDAKARLAWINANVVSTKSGRSIDKAAAELNASADQSFPVETGDELGRAIMEALDARAKAKQGDPTTDATREQQAKDAAASFATLAAGAEGQPFTASQLSRSLENGDEIKIGGEIFTVSEVDPIDEYVRMESDRFGPVEITGEDKVNLSEGANGNPVDSLASAPSPGGLSDVIAQIESAGVEMFASEKNGIIRLSKIIVPKSNRSKGIGTQSMQALLRYADSTNQQIALTPSADFGGSKARLEKFYRGLGFRTYKGFSVQERLIRDPEPGAINSPPSRYQSPSSMLAATQAQMQGAEGEKPAGLNSMFNPKPRIPATGERTLFQMPNKLAPAADIELARKIVTNLDRVKAVRPLLPDEQAAYEKATSDIAAQETLASAPSRVTPEQDAEYMAAVESGNVAKQQSMVGGAYSKFVRNTVMLGNKFYPATFIRFGNPPTNAEGSQVGSTGFDGGVREKGVSVIGAWHDPVRGKYVIPTGSEQAVAGVSDLVLQNRPVFVVSGSVSEDMGSDTEPLMEPGTVSTGKQLRYSDLVEENNPDFTLDGEQYDSGEEGTKNAYTGGKERWWKSKGKPLPSLSPVVRDAEGNVIPLSQRFNDQSDSILYSAPTESAPAQAAPDNEAQVREILDSMPKVWQDVLKDFNAGKSVEDIAKDRLYTPEQTAHILSLAQGRFDYLRGALPTKPKVAPVKGGEPLFKGGHPDLAYSSIPAFAAVDQNRGTPEQVTHAEMQVAATRMFAIDPAAAEKLVTRWMDGGGMAFSVEDMPDGIKAIVADAQTRKASMALMTAAAQIFTVENAFAGGSSAKSARLIDLYRNSGEEFARALSQRRDVFETPAERNAWFLSEVLLTPPPSIRSEMKRNPANKAKILADWAARADQIKKDLLAEGIDIDATMKQMAKERELAAATIPEAVKPALAQAPKSVRQAVKTILEGGSWQDAINASGLGHKAAQKAYNAFRGLRNIGSKIATGIRETLGSAPSETFTELPEWTDDVNLQSAPINTPQTKALAIHRNRKMEGEIDLKNDLSVNKTRQAMALRKASGFDKLMEYWKSSILSGPLSAIVNVSSGLGFGAYRVLFKKLSASVQADIIRLFGFQPDAPSLRDFPAMLSAVIPSLQSAGTDMLRSWNNETQFFDRFATDDGLFAGTSSDGEQFDPAIKGIFGKVMRGISFRHMTAADEFVKSFLTRIEVGAQALQIARNEGKTGEALATAMKDLMRPGSLAWERALSGAKVATFQSQEVRGNKLDSDIGSGERAIDVLDNLARILGKAKKGDFGSTVKVASHFLFPFVGTPTNIFKTGITMSPAGGLLALIDASRAVARSRKGNHQEAAKIYNAARAFDDITNQIVCWGVMLGIASLVKPGDDGEPPMITGSTEGDASSGERELTYRAAPPYSIRLWGKWYSYKRLDPLGTALAFCVDSVREFQKGKPIDKVWAKIGTGMLATMQDKTFMKSISDISNVLHDPERYGTRWIAGIATGFVPNLIRQPARATDHVFRETDFPNDMPFAESFARRIGFGMYPSPSNPLAPLPAVDAFGRESAKNTGTGQPGTDIMLRLISPLESLDATNVDPLDKKFLRYNMTHDKGFSFTAPPREITRTIGGKEIKISLSDEEYLPYEKSSGQAFHGAMNTIYGGKTADYSEQDHDDIVHLRTKVIKPFTDDAFSKALRKRQADQR